MQIIEKIKVIQEAAKRQGIVVTDILEDGTVVSDLPAYKRTYKLKEADLDMDYDDEDADKDEMSDDEDMDVLELQDEESKTEYDSKEAAATAVVDNIIMQDFDAAHEALQDYMDLYHTDEMSDDEDIDDVEMDGELDSDSAGTDEDYLLDVSDDDEDEKEV